MEPPKLTLVPPLPDLPWDGKTSRRYPDGSEIRVTENGILLIEAKEKYRVNRLKLVVSNKLPPG